MLDRILGIAGCAFGVAGIITGAVANKNNKKTNGRVDNIENDINTIKSQLKENDTNLCFQIEKIYDRIDKLDADMDSKTLDINDRINHELNNINNNLNDVKNTINTIDEANQKKFNGIANDLMGFNKWGKGVNVSIEQLEIYAEKTDNNFKPIIKPMLDERRRQQAQQQIVSENNNDSKTNNESVNN